MYDQSKGRTYSLMVAPWTFSRWACQAALYATFSIPPAPVLSTRSRASRALKLMPQRTRGSVLVVEPESVDSGEAGGEPAGERYSTRTSLLPKIISGGVMPSFAVMASISVLLRMGSLVVVMRKLWMVRVVVGEEGVGAGLGTWGVGGGGRIVVMSGGTPRGGGGWGGDVDMLTELRLFDKTR